MKKMLLAVVAMSIVVAGPASATQPPRGGVMWVDATGQLVAPYLSQPYYFDDANRIWHLNGVNVSPYYPPYSSYYQSTDCTGTAYVVLDPGLPILPGCVLYRDGLLYSISWTTSSVTIIAGSAWNGSACVTSPWPSGEQAGWPVSGLLPVTDPTPGPFVAPLHLEWR